jgi:hypothetical protein
MFAYGTERPFPDKYPHRFGATNEHVSEIKKMTAEELAQVSPINTEMRYRGVFDDRVGANHFAGL